MRNGVSSTGGRPRVVVIGAGLGGLAAAIRLQARGYAVTIVEKRDAPGGRAYVYRDAGFSFDGGPTVITAPWLLEELFALAGRRVDDHLRFVPVDPFYRIRFHDGALFDYTGDAARMEAEVARFCPGDVDGYRRFLVESEKIFRKGFEELGDVPFSRAVDMVKIVPAIVRLGCFRTVHGMVSRYVRDERLRTVLSFHPLLVGGNPFSTTSIYALIHFLERKWGVWFAMGGTGAIVAALVELFASLGGELRCSAPVEEILVEGGRASGVRLAGGATLGADIVVSNNDSAATYRQLLPPSARRTWTDARIDKLRLSMSLFVAYFGLRRKHPGVAHHTILLGPRYRGLLDDIFERKVLADDFSLYLHRPTATDPSLAPPDCDNFYVLSPVPHLGADIDWTRTAEPYRDKIYAFLEETALPGLRADLVTSRHVTPLHFRDELGSLAGAGFSIEPVLTQSAWFRPHNRSEELPNLFLVGAGTHPGAGMPGVLSSARVVDRLIPRLPDDGGRDPIAGTHAG
jgi:phytoene desaturase